MWREADCEHMREIIIVYSSASLIFKFVFRAECERENAGGELMKARKYVREICDLNVFL